MAKKKAARGPAAGSRIRVRDGVTMPEYPAIECGGWTGSLVDISGSKESPKYIVEWDDETMAKVPASYIEDCEKKQLLFTMACMPTDAIEFVEGGL